MSATTGHDDEPGADAFLDASDLIVAFSDSSDDDGNGYVDDIAGWDFFDDDNNSYDASSYSSANNHGTGRAEEAGEEGNEASDGIGVCPTCQIVPMRIWDTFVVDTNNFAQASLYAADNDIEVVEGASGGLFNSRFGRKAFEHAYREGVFFAIVSSDLNTADHNIPTLYDEAMQVQGTVADVQGLGQNPPQQFIDFFNDLGVPLGTNAPIQTWFRNSGTTQYGGHAHIVMPAVTGLGRDGPGLRCGRAGEVVRAPGGDGAGAERGQAAADRRRPSTSTSPTPSASAFRTRRTPAGTSTSATGCPTSASRWSGSTRGRSRRRR